MRCIRSAMLILLLAGAQARATVAEDLEAFSATADGAVTLGYADREAFLAGAEIVDLETLPVGITSSIRARLTDGRTEHDAHIQTIDVFKDRFTTRSGTYRNFRDSYRYNIAAYRLARLIGYDWVPVSVERKIGRDRAAVTWWVDDVAMMEVDRIRGGIQPPDLADFYHQLRHVRVFSQLIHNADLNPGNVLITSDWDLWAIDFTRSFRVDKRVDRDELSGRIDRAFLDGMRGLDQETLFAELRPHLTRPEIKALLQRRDVIVDHYEERVAQQGEAAILCDEVHAH